LAQSFLNDDNNNNIRFINSNWQVAYAVR